VHLHHLLILEDNASATVLMHHLGTSSQVHFTNVLTEISAARESRLSICKIQDSTDADYHISHTALHQAEDSEIQVFSVDIGARIVRNDIRMHLNGKGSSGSISGVFVGRDRQIMDQHTHIHHNSPNGTSRELYKGILTDHARGVFNGLIYVAPDAQQTDSEQTNRNLLLAETARMNSNPQLEIHADDVRCSHGSSTGQLDEDALFYLQSRGIDRKRALALMIEGFAGEVLNDLPCSSLQAKMFSHITDRLALAKI